MLSVARHQKVSDTLGHLLKTIRVFEDLGYAILAENARETLWMFLEALAPTYRINADLALLDLAFSAAGWHDQGVRWCDIDGDQAVCLVSFLDDTRTRWVPQ